VFAALVFLALGLSVWMPRIEPTRALAVVAGAASGFMGTVSSMGGPPMALLYQRAEGPRMRGTLSGFLGMGAVLSLLGLAAVGRFAGRELMLAATLLPGIALGFAVSHFLAPWIDRGRVRPAVLALSFAAALAVLARTLL